MPRDNSEFAFPQALDAGGYIGSEGMTLRQYYAGQALVQFLALQGEAWSGKRIPQPMAEQIAENCFRVADAMLRESAR